MPRKAKARKHKQVAQYPDNKQVRKLEKKLTDIQANSFALEMEKTSSTTSREDKARITKQLATLAEQEDETKREIASIRGNSKGRKDIKKEEEEVEWQGFGDEEEGAGEEAEEEAEEEVWEGFEVEVQEEGTGEEAEEKGAEFGDEMDIDKEQTGDQTEEELNESSDESSSESQSDSGHKSHSKGKKNTLSDDEADIWSPGMKIKPENNSDVTVEFYKAMGRNSFRLLTQRGPPNASSYRMERERDADCSFSPEHCTDLVQARNGDHRTWVFEKKHARAIQGVAPFLDGASIPLDADWDMIHDWLKPLPKKSGSRAIDVQVLVKWEIKGKLIKSWETRTTIRRLWGHDRADKAIYDAFEYQETRYEEYLSGARKATEKSPTPGPKGFIPSPTPEPEAKKDRKSRQVSFNGEKTSVSTKVPRKKSMKESEDIDSDPDLNEIKMLYCQEKLEGKDVSKMTPMEEMMFRKYYKKMTSME
ncbi:hypothetical protein ACMFMF_011800 [Clarireedia jacksonii]